MRMKCFATAYVIAACCLVSRAMAEQTPTFDSDCTAWASSACGAGVRPSLELLVDEVATGRYKQPDLDRLRLIAKDLYAKDEDIRGEFKTVDDYVRFSVEENTKQPLDYAENYRYRIAITSNRFLVSSTNAINRHGRTYHALAGLKVGRQYKVVAANYDSGESGKAAWTGGVDEYVDIFQYGALSRVDVAALDVMWKVASTKNDDELWRNLCAGGGVLEVNEGGLEINITTGVVDSRRVVRIECRTDDRKGGVAFVIDRADGRILPQKEEWSVQGLKRVRCSEFLPVEGGSTLYPRAIVVEEYDPVGTPVATRVLTVRSVIEATNEAMYQVDWNSLIANPSNRLIRYR